jgi:hypothetical protein
LWGQCTRLELDLSSLSRVATLTNRDRSETEEMSSEIAEVKFKTYPLPKLLGGMLVFKFDEAEKIIVDLQTMLDADELPSQLSIGCHFSKRGGSPAFMMMFSWASVDFEEGKRWLNKIKTLGTVLMDMVSESKLYICVS